MNDFISQEQQKKIQIELLQYIHEICNQNNINYSLCGGSLIGAIRHNGFIPWDDDVDLFLVREEYERLIDILKKENKYKLVDKSTNDKYYYFFAKLVKPNTELHSRDECIPDDDLGIGVFVDIFPIDGLPDDAKERTEHIKKLQYMLECVYLSVDKRYYHSPKKYKRIIKKNLLLPKHLYHKFRGMRKELYILEECMKKYSVYNSKYSGIVITQYGNREVLPSEVYLQYSEHDFEGMQVSIIRDYDVYLSSLYGEYMNIPPKEKQVAPHLFDFIYKN